jgi:hypothetical protein
MLKIDSTGKTTRTVYLKLKTSSKTGDFFQWAAKNQIIGDKNFSLQGLVSITLKYASTGEEYVMRAPEDSTTSLTRPKSFFGFTGDVGPLGNLTKKNTDSNWTRVGLDVSCNFIDLLNGTEYEFKVRVVTTNSYYTSDPDSTTDEVIGAEASINNIPYLPLEPPLIVDCVAQDKSVALSWAQPTLLGLELDHYEVSGGALSEPVSVGTSLTYIFTGLENNTEYSFMNLHID